MKSSICKNIEAIAFDLDGTLYDEYDFVRQAYRSVSKVMSYEAGLDEEKLYKSLCRNWLLYGSSGNVFQMAFEEVNGCSLDEELLEKSVREFRNADFELSLSQRTIDLLDAYRDYRKVIITDGNSNLQRNKYNKLGLSKWIDEEDVFVSGDYGKEFYKPNPYMGNLVKERLGTEKIMYFGDRDIDRQFAQNTGFDFRLVKNMILV